MTFRVTWGTAAVSTPHFLSLPFPLALFFYIAKPRLKPAFKVGALSLSLCICSVGVNVNSRHCEENNAPPGCVLSPPVTWPGVLPSDGEERHVSLVRRVMFGKIARRFMRERRNSDLTCNRNGRFRVLDAGSFVLAWTTETDRESRMNLYAANRALNLRRYSKRCKV